MVKRKKPIWKNLRVRQPTHERLMNFIKGLEKAGRYITVNECIRDFLDMAQWDHPEAIKRNNELIDEIKTLQAENDQLLAWARAKIIEIDNKKKEEE